MEHAKRKTLFPADMKLAALLGGRRHILSQPQTNDLENSRNFLVPTSAMAGVAAAKELNVRNS